MKKKVALSATAIAVLASTVPTHVALVQAEETGRTIYTKFDSSVGNDVSSGNGSDTRPFNLFKDALREAQDGDTIVIVDKGFINDGGGNLPFIIDKEVKIVGSTRDSYLEVNAAGILITKDVTFENLHLNFGNLIHDAIFANGHTLTLNNVARYDKAREIDLFAGTLYMDASGVPVREPGQKGVINVYTDNTLDGSTYKSEFGNIYGGSMNGIFNGDAEINLTRANSNKHLTVKGIYASGALQAPVSDNWFDGVEPEPPTPMPNQFITYGDVNVTLDDYNIPIDGNTGSMSNTKLTSIARNYTVLNITNVDI